MWFVFSQNHSDCCVEKKLKPLGQQRNQAIDKGGWDQGGRSKGWEVVWIYYEGTADRVYCWNAFAVWDKDREGLRITPRFLTGATKRMELQFTEISNGGIRGEMSERGNERLCQVLRCLLNFKVEIWGGQFGSAELIHKQVSGWTYRFGNH